MHEIVKDAVGRMDKSYTVLQDTYRRLGHAQSGGFLDTIRVEYFGSQTPLNQIAVITRPHPGRFLVRPHDATIVKDVEKAIQRANLNVGVAAEKAAVVVTVPSPTIEQKRDMARHARSLAEEAKVAVRKVRQDARTTLKKAGLPEDDEKKAEKALQEKTDAYCKMIEEAAATKEKVLVA